eukprot:TRINITY_DN30543_c0_g1_i2.p1 TRINITY_DN30543_c0_g1~~TRINITY_DN30543_c0_g1_i2.p1  ORF type:complete len:287 (+),score=40.92 TRINITY_DN30543_c0_g1_i2:44-904(+)
MLLHVICEQWSLADAAVCLPPRQPEPVAPFFKRLLHRLKQGLTWKATAVAAVCGLLATLRPRRLRWLRGRIPPSTAIVPEDYRAAGVVFYTNDKLSGVGYVLLGIEERMVPLRELGLGSGSAPRKVLVFLQGKREPEDANFIDTARREFMKETGDAMGLADHMQAGCTTASWYPAARMVVVFCEVPASDVVRPQAAQVLPSRPAEKQRRQQPRQQEKRSKQKEPLALKLVWVHASDLRACLETANPGSNVVTELGQFPLFPVTRKFLQSSSVLRWLGSFKPPRRWH